MTQHPYRNTTSQAERAAVLKNDVRARTFHGRAMLELEQEQQGRFARSANVTGAEASTQYPQLPETSPWHNDPVGVEPPLGLDISAVEPVGEPHEIERSLARLSSLQASGSASTDVSCFDGAERGVEDLAGEAPPSSRSSATPIQHKPNLRWRPIA